MNITDLLTERSKLRKRIFSLKMALLVAIVAVVTIIYPRSSSITSSSSSSSEYIGIVKIDFEIFEDPKFENLLDSVTTDNSIKALVIDINSPGGSTGASERIYHQLNKIKKNIPVVASMSSIAASGGYMIALSADKIFALNTTITGSIGVVMQVPEIVNLAEKLGVKFKNYKSSPLKASPNPTEITSAEADEAIMKIIKDSHEYFIELVSKNRKLDYETAKSLSDGRVLTGRQALALKLVDQIGTIDDAVDWLRTEKKLGNLDVKELKPKKHSEIYDIIFDKLEEGSKSLVNFISSKLTISLTPNSRLNQTNDFKGEASGSYPNIGEADDTSKNHQDHLKMKFGII
jgi:protease-4